MTGFPSAIDLEFLDPEYGFAVRGAAAGDAAGFSVSDAGDIDGDGYGDFIVGARRSDAGGYNAGGAYVLFGKAGGSGEIDLATLAGADGFFIQGDAAGDLAGLSVSSAGDVNGDGFDDIVIGAHEGNDGGDNAGEAYVIFGKANGFGTIDLTSLAAPDGFVIQGHLAGDRFGTSVSSAGDINGDGYDDLIGGAPGNDSGGTSAGRAYVIFGAASFADRLDLTFLSSAGFGIRGDVEYDYAGVSVSGAGDVNGDGFDDVVVGVNNGDDGGNAAGEAYVVFGKASGFGTVDLTALAPPDGFIIQGDAAYDNAGFSVSSAGDVNGDGFGDVVVGARFGDDGGASAGEAYVIFGKATGFGTIDLTSLSSSNGFIVRGGVSSQAGISVSEAGDVNGDGFGDIIVGAAYGDDGGDNAGQAYVIFGKAAEFGAIDLAALDAADGFAILGEAPLDLAGRGVSAAGDVDGDGFDDVIVGAYGNDAGGANAGAAYVIYGRGDGAGDFPLIYEASAISPAFGGVIVGDVAGDYAGSGIAAGDVNGDGYDDLIVGAPEKGANGAQSGSSWLLFGSAAGFGDLDLTTLGTDIGIRIDGAGVGDLAGASVAAGDVNGDGLADIIIGAPGYNSNAGATYVLFGKAAGWSDIDLGALVPADGFAIIGDAAGDRSGASVAGAGDVDGDGFGDIIVGARYGDDGGTSAGEAYVIFGKAGGFGTIDLGALASDDGFAIQGDAAYDNAGFSVSSAGDVNSDGLDDLIVGAPLGDNSATNAGEAYVIFGKASGLGDIDLTSLTPADGFIVRGDNAHDNAGRSISGVGDFNGDGLDDMVIGAHYNDAAGASAGAAYLVFGKTGLANVDLGALGPGDGFAILGDEAGDWLGRPAANAGDVNGDGFDDILIGAIFGGDARGNAYVVFGKASGFGTVDLSALTVDQGFVVANDGPGGFDLRVASGGDVNGDGLDDILVGDPSSDDGGNSAGRVLVIHGRLPGNDVVRTGSAIGQTINGGRGDDELSGLGGGDRLVGGGGDDILEGGTGNDRLFGEGGADTARYVDAGAGVTLRLVLTTAQDTGGAGSDTLSSIENAIGSAFADVIAGTSGANRLEGGGGIDTLGGQGGEDVLIGGSGDDVLRGGGGNDEMRGGTSDDIYFVNDSGDRAIEGLGQGHDQVKAFLDHVLADNIEELRLFGAAASGTGNDLDNAIFGSSIANTLLGLGGNDTLRGQSGVDELRGGDDADILYGALGNDRLFGDAGEDRMNGEDGVDFLSGGSGEDRLFGGGGADALHGGTGADALNGGIQRDTMTGNSGADQFVFGDGDTAATRNGADIVTDFDRAEDDRINLRQIDANANAGGDQNFTFVGDAAFSGAAGELRYSQAQGNTYIEGDTDGDGNADFMIRLDGLVEPVAGDFVL